MERVLIIGCSGSGKSSLARDLARITGLPVIHLDREFWRPGWIEPDKTLWPAKVSALAEGPRWIVDGNYASTLAARLARADTVVHLDLPRRTCLWGVLRRTLRLHGRTREDMTENCPERFDWEFFKYIWNYNRDHRPHMMEVLQGYSGQKVVLKSRADVARYLADMRGSGSGHGLSKAR